MQITKKIGITLLIALAIWLLSACNTSKTASKATVSKWQNIDIHTSAQCGMCKKYIEDALYAQPGVSIAELNLGNKVVSIKYNTQKTDDKTLKKAIAAAGYDAEEVPADKAAYDLLPACCKKGGMEE